jgi:GDPmannose 4,6-dehydratase
LGNLEARRDWGYAGDYVRAMWLMLNQPIPDDYVVGSGVTHSVRDFCEIAFRQVGLDYSQYVVQDQRFFHQADQNILVSNSAKALQKLGWKPEVSFEEMIKMMVEADINFNS